MNLEMQRTLLNTDPPKLIATVLTVLREQLKENDQLNSVEEIAGPAPEIPLEYDQILKEEDSGMLSTEDICQKTLCWLRDVQRLNGYILKLFTKLSRCKIVKMQARSCLS